MSKIIDFIALEQDLCALVERISASQEVSAEDFDLAVNILDAQAEIASTIITDIEMGDEDACAEYRILTETPALLASISDCASRHLCADGNNFLLKFPDRLLGHPSIALAAHARYASDLANEVLIEAASSKNLMAMIRAQERPGLAQALNDYYVHNNGFMGWDDMSDDERREYLLNFFIQQEWVVTVQECKEINEILMQEAELDEVAMRNSEELLSRLQSYGLTMDQVCSPTIH